MTDEVFINYMEAHSRTERALFKKDHINRLLTLAGEEPNQVIEWQPWFYRDMESTLTKAKSNIGYK